MSVTSLLVFSEADDHTYCHHEILVGEFPLVMEWLNFDPNQPEEYGMYTVCTLNTFLCFPVLFSCQLFCLECCFL